MRTQYAHAIRAHAIFAHAMLTLRSRYAHARRTHYAHAKSVHAMFALAMRTLCSRHLQATYAHAVYADTTLTPRAGYLCFTLCTRYAHAARMPLHAQAKLRRTHMYHKLCLISLPKRGRCETRCTCMLGR